MSEDGNYAVRNWPHIPVDFFLLTLMMMLPCSELDQSTDMVKKDPERKENSKISSD